MTAGRRASMLLSMAFFPDLSKYAYGSDGGASEDVNIGWLAAEHEFTRGAVAAEVVDALLTCCTRPVRLYRGMHSCDLCEVPLFWMRFDGPFGRDVSIGNGEIRVCGSDGRWYAAPTLVAHYVAHHEYLPPHAFCDAVVSHARSLYVVRGEQFQRFEAMNIDQRLELCIAVLRDLAAQQRVSIEGLVPRIIDSANGDPDQAVWQNGWKDRRPPEYSMLDDRLKRVLDQILGGFTAQRRLSPHSRDVQTLRTATYVVERAADHGLDASRY